MVRKRVKALKLSYVNKKKYAVQILAIITVITLAVTSFISHPDLSG
jgi:hypothetical protein